MNTAKVLLNLVQKILPQFKGTSRSIAAKKNIFLLLIFNGFNFLFNILLVRLTLDYLGQESYGIWITLASVLTWFSYLDFGLGNGLRNKLAEAFVRNEYQLARIYVSTTYAVFSVALIIVYILFLLIYHNVEWTIVFNTSANLKNELSLLVFYVFTFFIVNFVLRLITYLTAADQKPALNGLFSFIVNLLTVILVYLLIRIGSKSILYLGAGSTLIPVIVFFAASLFLFKGRYKAIAPSIKLINLKYSGDLIGLGFRFFIMQAAGLIVFATDNMIITQIFGPDDVAVYNIAFRYFNYIPVIFYTILNPLWSAYTDAYVKNDIEWIENTVKKVLKFWIILSLVVFIMILAANDVYNIWLDSQITVPFILTILMGVFAIVSNWNNIFVFFINGVGKIKISLYVSLFTGIVNIPLSIFLAKNLEFGISGVIAATLICIFTGSILAPLQYYKIINKTDTGIWGK